ncbi:hypothetical protein LQ938_11635 [Microbacterium sp. cx-55]|nr:hypothetical protein [Microbacterium sp. cx-55]UGB34518.1 hypothetical protein LQ938_11635 [Microbacterium sp. cx-55]
MTYVAGVDDKPEYLRRAVGPYGRTWLTSRADWAHISGPDIARTVQIIDAWQKSGVNAASPELATLRAVSAASAGGMGEDAMMGLLLIALEGAVGTSPANGGSVEQFTRGLRPYAQPEEVPDFESYVASLYAHRSDLVHGRALAEVHSPDLRWTVDVLARIAEAKTLPPELRIEGTA